MESKKELQAMLERIESKWDSGNVGGPEEIVKMDKQRKELRRKLLMLSNTSP